MLSQAAIKQAWAPPCRGPWVEIGLHGAGRVTVRRSLYEAVKALDACLRAWNYRTRYADTGAYVCLAGETLVATPDGWVPIRDLAGGEAKVLTTRGEHGTDVFHGSGVWTTSDVLSYGFDRLWAIHVTDGTKFKTFRATEQHRWYITDGTAAAEVATCELAPGDTLATVTPDTPMSAGWTVLAVEDTGDIEEVFCASVEDTSCFVIDGHVLTGNCRQKVSGGGYSLHAYAIALDLNWKSNLYSRKLVTDMPRGMVNAICAIRTNNGKQVWNWGGFWSGTKDAMHYEVVCSPGDLATGIRRSTVPGAGAGMPHVPAPQPQPQPSQPAPPKEPVKVPLPPSASWETDMTGWVRHKNGTIARVTDDTFHPLTAIEWAADQFLYYQATGRQLDAARIGGMLWSLDDTSWNNFMAGRKYVPPIA